MKRFLLLLPLLSLVACVSTPVMPPPALAELKQCHAGPDGAPLVADRGIGGTGISATRQAERGIGGTGGPLTRTADRGIGGTGISGIVSGFASVCVDGLEVALDDQAAIDIDGIPADRDALRVGQLVAIHASGTPEQAPVATRISVRHEVSGPVEEVLSVDPGLIVVAGQRVRVPSKTVGSMLIQPGVWVAVSGLRGPDGDIVASRLDPRAAGPVLVRGPLIVADREASIGSLEIRIRRDTRDDVGTFVTASGTYVNGTLIAGSLTPDLLVSDPPAWFGPRTTRLVLESYGRFSAAGATISGGFQAGLATGLEPPRDLSGPLVMSLQQQADGSFAVIRVNAAPPPSTPVAPGGGARATPGAGDSARPYGAGSAQTTVSAMGTAGAGQPPAPGQTAVANMTVSRSYQYAPMRPSEPAAISMNTSGGTGIVYGSGTVIGASRIEIRPGAAPRAFAAGGGTGSIGRIGGIRLLGGGAAGGIGHAATGMIAPRAFGVHQAPRFRFGH